MSPTVASDWEWRKSTRCESQMCVEVATVGGQMAVRDSADPQRHLMIAPAGWRAFIAGVRAGEFDLP